MDLGKTTFHLMALGERGEVVMGTKADGSGRKAPQAIANRAIASA
jgi:hypothetical protein